MDRKNNVAVLKFGSSSSVNCTKTRGWAGQNKSNNSIPLIPKNEMTPNQVTVVTQVSELCEIHPNPVRKPNHFIVTRQELSKLRPTTVVLMGWAARVGFPCPVANWLSKVYTTRSSTQNFLPLTHHYCHNTYSLNKSPSRRSDLQYGSVFPPNMVCKLNPYCGSVESLMAEIFQPNHATIPSIGMIIKPVKQFLPNCYIT